MKPSAGIFLLIILSLLWACGPKPGVLIVPDKAVPGDELFSTAEAMFQTKSYQKALDAYNEYLNRFPDRPLAAGALMKIGAIHLALGDYAKARGIYQQLIAKYPESSFVRDAEVEILFSFYSEGKYVEVIERAADFLKNAVSRVHIVRTQVLLGDTYMAIGSPIDAAIYYAQSYEKAHDLEKETIVAKLEESAKQLDSADIEFLLRRMEDKVAAGYLMYQLGLNRSEEEAYEEAVKVLAAFIANFPQHENIQQAKELLETISKKSVYSRYTIGCLLPFSGRYQTYGNRAFKGVELALKQFISQGGNPALKVIFKNTASDSDTAAMAVKELYKENVAAIIGPLVTAETAALEAQKSGIPIITLTQKDDITKLGDYVFRNFIIPEMQVKTLVSFVVETLGLDSFAVLYPDENYGKTFMNLFWDEVLTLGGRIVGVESYNPSHTDFADPIKKLVGLYYEVPEGLKDEIKFGLIEDYLFPDLEPSIEANAAEPIENAELKDEKDEEPQPVIDFDAVFIPDSPATAGLIIPQLAFHDIRGTYLLGTNLWHSDDLIKSARQYAQGAIMTDGFFAQSDAPHVREFTALFEKTFGEKPDFIEAVAYDTAMILFEMVSRPDIRYRSTLKQELMKLKNYQGVTGQTSFDNSGEAFKKLYLLQIKRDGFVEIGAR